MGGEENRKMERGERDGNRTKSEIREKMVKDDERRC